ncbi:30S ribosomal protein S13 [Candidatus Woesebacteria bacterium RBG_16_36_11]|uniref:Small ribosomal subunit protein uS13 n=3 Tax=Candidatus Woeseibacteriota TaxID=1752722 RepID=A0A1F7XBF6_9BACT|nr:MAG: 30S ribosomal protein S13 [Candidatus Woesebacteria bacterium RBG_13_36_22]OGM12357.1 MAG: 30S ribosomal protein S13 [Candidatus Woesebacteria bacterium RBG_16_36_11]OGM17224.1 MAG: 30S ribosomal protein S13 [Candidatus Woesebacteria bacterium RBG_19FT_COMBO_37_29]
MARIAGIDLQDNLRIDYALTKIKGIGWSLSKKILKNLKIDESKRISELSSGELTKTAAKVEEFTIEGELARNVKGNISRLREIGTYRGIRHARGLPSRGQRTRTNARTKRGKRKTVGAFKKEMLSRQGTPTSEEK